MNLWRLKNEQMLPDYYGAEERDGEVYIYDSRDTSYDREDGYVNTGWISTNEEEIYDLKDMI